MTPETIIAACEGESSMPTVCADCARAAIREARTESLGHIQRLREALQGAQAWLEDIAKIYRIQSRYTLLEIEAVLKITAPTAKRPGECARPDCAEPMLPDSRLCLKHDLAEDVARSRSESRRLEVQRGENIAPVSAVSDASPAAIGPRKGQRRDVDAASSTVARMAQEAATSFKPGEVEDAAERDGPHGRLVGESPEPGRMDGSREQNCLGKTEPGQDRPSSPSPSPRCGPTHWEACPCREAEFAALADEVARLRARPEAARSVAFLARRVLSKRGGANWWEWDDLQAALSAYDAATRGNGGADGKK